MNAHSTATRNAIAALVAARVNLGSLNPTGAVRFKVGGTTAVTVALQNPAFSGVPSGGGVDAALPIAESLPADMLVSGNLTSYELLDRDRNLVVSGTVTAVGGGGDIEMNTVVLVNDTTINITGLRYNAPP